MIRDVGWLLAAVALLAGCVDQASGGGAGARDQIRVVGSSTVFPFTTSVAEQFVNKNPGFKSPIVESTGTGAGIKLFCAGVGPGFPDIVNASRRIKKSEYQDCKKNGVADVIEIQVGIDGLAFAESKGGPGLRLTPLDVYKALAANPFGGPNSSRNWRDVNPALPPIPIQVYGPPSTSGTRDSLVELILQPGCKTDPAMAALEKSDEKRFKDVCTRVREDGAYVDSGENDNLIVQKLGANPDAIGIFGYSFLEENLDSLHGVPMNDVEPSLETLNDGSYPGARALYIYVKSAHLKAIPGLRQYLLEYAQAWNPGGYLARRGLIPAHDEVRAASTRAATTLQPLDIALLE